MRARAARAAPSRACAPAVGIATTLAVLVGAASAGGYTLLQDDKQPPPPADDRRAGAAGHDAGETLPPGDAGAVAATRPPPARRCRTRRARTSAAGRRRTGSAARQLHRSCGSGGSRRQSSSGGGSVEPDDARRPTTTPQEPQFALTDIALGAAAVAYAPYAAPDVDLGDPSRAVDGSTRTAWKAPVAADPAAPPQIGVYVDLAGKEKLRKLVLQTPTPGMSIEIYGATSGPPAAITDPGWDHLASRSGIAAQTKVKLPDAAPTATCSCGSSEPPPDGARPAISELSLLSLQPE